MDDVLTRYWLVSEEDLKRCHLSGARLLGCYLSEIALVVSLQIDKSSSSPTAEFRDQLPFTMRLLQDRLRRYGVDCPAAVVMHCSKNSLESYRKLVADQDWHRGEFSLFVEASIEAENRIRDLLYAKPPENDIAPSGKELQDVRDYCKTHAVEGSLLKKLVDAWAQDTTDESTEEKRDAGVGAIRDYLAPLNTSVSEVLSILR